VRPRPSAPYRDGLTLCLAPHAHKQTPINAEGLSLVSQCYIKGHPGNEKDGVWKGIKDPRQRENVTVDLAALAGSTLGDLAAKWDIVMGVTPEHG